MRRPSAAYFDYGGILVNLAFFLLRPYGQTLSISIGSSLRRLEEFQVDYGHKVVRGTGRFPVSATWAPSAT